MTYVITGIISATLSSLFSILWISYRFNQVIDKQLVINSKLSKRLKKLEPIGVGERIGKSMGETFALLNKGMGHD